MLNKIKLLTYNVYYGMLKIQRDFPKKNAYQKSVTELNWQVSYTLIALFLVLLLHVVEYEAIVEFWPYDFGREHGKNFIAPGTIFFLLIWYLSRRAFIHAFMNEKAFSEMERYYGSEGIEHKEHSKLINIDTFLFYATAGSIAFQVWFALILCILAFISQEIWIRKRFSSSKPKK